MSLPLLFALAFPVEAPPEEPVFTLEVPAAAYATMTRADLSDLAVVDATGKPMPIALQWPSAPPSNEVTLIPLPAPIVLGGTAEARGDALHLAVQRDAQGRLQRVELSQAAPEAEAAPTAWIEAEAARNPGYDGLRIAPKGDADFQTRVDIRGSDDLLSWQPVASALPLLRISDGERRIERLELRFPTTRYRYLVLRPTDAGGTLPPIEGLVALRETAAAARVLALELTPRDGGRENAPWRFDSPGPLPVISVGVELPATNTTARFELSRSDGSTWTPVVSGTTWRLEVEGRPVFAEPLRAGLPDGDGLGLVLQPATNAPPRLVLRYTPHQVVVIASGQPPYTLMAGSGSYRDVGAPVQEALDGLRRVRDADWVPPLAQVGPPRATGVEQALTPASGIDPGRFALWAVLGLGALGVGGVALRLLRGSKPPG